MKMRGRYRVSLVVALTLCLAPIVASEEKGKGSEEPKSTRPPTALKRMPDGHWTPWTPPETPAGANVHTIATGETLWGLADQNLKNPYLWPQIWDQNRYVLDSHWIYPGDPIVLPSPEVVPKTPPATTFAPGISISEPPPPPSEGAPQAKARPFQKPTPPPPANPLPRSTRK